MKLMYYLNCDAYVDVAATPQLMSIFVEAHVIELLCNSSRDRVGAQKQHKKQKTPVKNFP